MRNTSARLNIHIDEIKSFLHGLYAPRCSWIFDKPKSAEIIGPRRSPYSRVMNSSVLRTIRAAAAQLAASVTEIPLGA